MYGNQQSTQVCEMESVCVSTMSCFNVHLWLRPGLDIIGSSAAEFGLHLKREGDKYAEAVRMSGAKME